MQNRITHIQPFGPPTLKDRRAVRGGGGGEIISTRGVSATKGTYQL